MKVLKFGGSSVGSIESLKNLQKIVEQGSSQHLIVVVSALGGVTDQLIAMAKEASAGNQKYRNTLDSIQKRHFDIIDTLVDDRKKSEVKQNIAHLLAELSNLYEGLTLIRDLSQRTLDLVVSYGERMSSVIVSAILPGSELYHSPYFIKTKSRWGKHLFDKEDSIGLITKTFESFLNGKPSIAVVPGFISTDYSTGNITNLGRGGSDYTAAILAAVLKASILEIWTDVDGFMTADPRVINTAYAIDYLSFTEAMELCNFGAKVIYPPTIYPVYLENIPILIKNTFNPTAKGTLISSTSHEEHSEGKLIKGISSISDTSLVSISGLGMVGIPGINARIFNALAKNGISVFMVSQASSENSTSLAVRDADAEHARVVLSDEFHTEIANGNISEIKVTSGLSTVAVVGANMRQVPGVAGKLFNTLGRNGINMIACAQGANETNISFVVNTNALRKTLNVIHDSFFLSQTQILNLFIIGTGNVGTSLINQICSQQEELLKSKALEIKVVGIANSRKALFNREGIQLNDFKENLMNNGVHYTPAMIENEVITMNIFNPVFVDCTSNPDIAALYENLLNHNVNVVAANKYSASGPYENYTKLKNIARRKDVKFLFETNVGAGLPIISTLNSLINSGDRILKVEAVLSGTLNYIFNVLDEETGLSRAVEMAKEKGYTEADPRIDLSGDDVMKKIVILARESGYRIEKEEVEQEPFIPKEYFLGTINTFMKALKSFDIEFEKKRKEVADKGGRYRFVATFENGKARIGLKEISSVHPFYNIEGSNNMIALTTERYKEFPIVIKGYGAGAEVTAAGVFADIISIANIR